MSNSYISRHNIKKPKMVLFDYGQTLANETFYDMTDGIKAVLENCVSNPDNVTAEEIQLFARKLNNKIGKNPEAMHLYTIEIHNHQFQKFLYEYFNIEAKVSPVEMEKVFWDNFAPGVKTENISEFLLFLHESGIRTGIISNMPFSEKSLYNRINSLIPENYFEFIITSSEYIFRKPEKLIFEIALKKARLDAENVWYCGDNPVWDVDGAACCGMTPIWYTGASISPAKPKSECIRINDWTELSEIISGL